MQAVLVMFRSDGERRSFSISRDMTVVGRREDCDLRIPLSDVSRKHCRFVRDGDTLRLEDLGSSNGTFCNGQRVGDAVLNPGDSIQVGPVIFVLQVDGEPPDDQLHPIGTEQAEPAEQFGEEPEVTMNSNMGPLSPTAQSEAGEELAAFETEEFSAETPEGTEAELGTEGEFAPEEQLGAEGQFGTELEFPTEAESGLEAEEFATEAEPRVQVGEETEPELGTGAAEHAESEPGAEGEEHSEPELAAEGEESGFIIEDEPANSSQAGEFHIDLDGQEA